MDRTTATTPTAASATATATPARTPANADPPPPLGLLEYLDLGDHRSVRAKRETAFEAALLAEQVGYQRLWLPEHHSTGVPSPNPLLLAGVLGSHTTRIRIGTAVTLIRVRDPHLTAEDVASAAFFCGDRLDVGFGRGDVAGSAADALAYLRKGGDATDEAIRTVVSVLDDGRDWIDPLDTPYERWLHGAGTRSAELAGEMGFNYCHALFFNVDVDACTRTLNSYRAAFPNGRTAVAAALVANDDPVIARTDSIRAGIKVNCAGTAEQCAAAVCKLLELTGADEVVITEMSRSADDHLRALKEIFGLVAERLGGRPRSAGPADRAATGGEER
ncbi:LLM class flavin-dependent oxidoreductase [Nocardiopsis gilva]|nr:LLM class flavin-dependent oxidoreductase [Nocardiopsis gilva]